MRRDIFVFAGQSNMMGASVYPPGGDISARHSFEYKHKPRRLGKGIGDFTPAAFPAGEFSYADTKLAYSPDMTDENGKSKLTDYRLNTFFCPSMSALTDGGKKGLPFSAFSESTAKIGPTLAPLLAMEWEKLGYSSLYAHIAKGSIRIAHYMTDEMAEEYRRRISSYNEKHGTSYAEHIPTSQRMKGAADYFIEKCRDFFEDSQKKFKNDEIASHSFFWLQGEGDADNAEKEYETKLEILWEKLKEIGFTHFFCIRVGFWGNENIVNVMKAEEHFTKTHEGAYMLTRCASYFKYYGQDESDWFISDGGEEYEFCRDSFYGFGNQHFNEKGFSVIAKHAITNLYRVLIEEKEPILEKENIKKMLRTEDGNE